MFLYAKIRHHKHQPSVQSDQRTSLSCILSAKWVIYPKARDAISCFHFHVKVKACTAFPHGSNSFLIKKKIVLYKQNIK